LSTGRSARWRSSERLREGITTRAVLLEDLHVATGEHGERKPVHVLARWTDRDGLEHIGVLLTTRSEPAGAEVDVWIDAAGEITSRPVRPANAVFGGITAAVGVLCAGATLLVATWLGVRRVTGLCNSRRWEQEWACMEPQWRRTIL
jgi:hypothetical protein